MKPGKNLLIIIPLKPRYNGIFFSLIQHCEQKLHHSHYFYIPPKCIEEEMDIHIPPHIIYCAGNYACVSFRGPKCCCNAIMVVRNLVVFI